jgi:hypothetical protein
MTTATGRLEDRLRVEQITPQRAVTMLLTGVLPDEEVAKFRPSRLTLDAMTKLLDNKTSDRRNRKVTIPRVTRMARDMTNDAWRFTGDPIKLDQSGFVIDGQHRLLAIFASGVKQPMAILYGADEATQLVVDTGRPRSANDQLTIRGTRHARYVSAAASMLLRWRAGQILNSMFQPTVTEITEFVEGQSKLFNDAAVVTLRLNHHIKYAPVGALIAVYYQATELVEVEKRDYFFERLTRGDELTVNDPVLTLRNTLLRYTPDRPVPFRMTGRLWQCVHAWNKWRDGEKIQLLRVPSTLTSDSFPKMR